MSEEILIYRTAGGIARLTFNRPEAMHGLNVEMASAFRVALERALADPDLRALVITGSGRAFSAGGDVTAFHAHADDAPAYLREVLLHFHTGLEYLMELEAPVIAAVNGMTAGAGMGICMAADLAIAAESAVFTMAYTAIGATPDGSSTWFLPRLVGLRRAMELVYTNRRLDAREAEEWGLVNRVVPDGELAAEVTALAERLAAGPTRAYAGARRLIRESLDNPLHSQLALEERAITAMGATADFREGIAAFAGKRPAVFRGR